MRARTIDDFIGQEHFFYKGSLLYNAVKNKNFDSAIFSGKSGTGKTTLARIIGKSMDEEFIEINATTIGTKELKEILDKARLRFDGLRRETTYIYVDELHRWNKLQQDSLLKALEEGVIRLIASTTENPQFTINNAILSRVRHIYHFEALKKEHLEILLKRALSDKKNGLGQLNLNYEPRALELLAELSNGDARVCLDTLGFIAYNIEDKIITPEIVGEALQEKIEFFTNGDDKYNLLSALQKSIRGSDPDASIYYLVKLIEAGCDIQMIGRRLLVIASEDIGMAYPSAITIVESCISASLMVGYPEARINLAHAVILLASSPKSNSAYMAYNKAEADIRSIEIDDIPEHIKDAHSKMSKLKGNGKNYLYPHSYGGYVNQQYLPDNLYKKNVKYYEPTENGNEKQFKKFLKGLEENGNY